MNQPNGELIIYQTSDGNIKIDVRLSEKTVWLTQAQLCELFQKSKATISEHIKNVFEEGELDEKVVVRNFRTTTKHGAMVGKTQEMEVNGYNLNIPHYLDTFEDEEEIDVDVVQVEIDRLENELVEARLQMSKKLKEIQR